MVRGIDSYVNRLWPTGGFYEQIRGDILELAIKEARSRDFKRVGKIILRVPFLLKELRQYSEEDIRQAVRVGFFCFFMGGCPCIRLEMSIKLKESKLETGAKNPSLAPMRELKALLKRVK